jgi:hypothetical protein
MMRLSKRTAVGLILIACASLTGGAAECIAPAPLFADPNYHGSCDPEIVWNEHAREWWIFYTARRAKLAKASYVGTPIGVARSADLCHWKFGGYCSFDGVEGKPDMPVSFWAPGIVRNGDTYHMFATYKDNAVPPWGGKGTIVHYVAPATNLLSGWKKSDVPAFTDDCIDATLIKVGDEFRAYYRVGVKPNYIVWSVSKDLVHWENKGPCPGDINDEAKKDFDYQEAPFVFRFADAFWMLTDPHKGLVVYKSNDGVRWVRNNKILEQPGKRENDNTLARHPSVAVQGERAILFYHVEPWRPYPSPPPEVRTVQQKLSFLQTAELKVTDGKLTCDRDQAVVFPTQ